MQYTAEQLHKHLYEKTDTIYEVFKNFFGEERVDLQEFNTIKDRELLQELRISKNSDGIYDISDEDMCTLEREHCNYTVTIYVWWPNVTVTNEYDKSIHIKDLYAKITIECDGTIPWEERGFSLNRATYTVTQIHCNYMHSHVESIPTYDFSTFIAPCLGTGPINNTINTLKSEYDEIAWMLFCQELDTYVTVESLDGVPYHRLENVNADNELYLYSRGYNYNCIDIEYITNILGNKNLKDFIIYYLKNGHLSISYKYNHYTGGMLYYDYIIDISNAFIDFYNTHLKSPSINIKEYFDTRLLYKATVKNKRFYSCLNNIDASSIIKKYSNKSVLGFKGKEIFTTIIDDTFKVPAHKVIILNHNLAMWILHKILKIIDYNYGNEYSNNTEGSNESSSSGRRTLYL